MTEPDEALICARRWRCKNLQDLGFPPSLVQSVSEGSTDETLQSFAHGYRAGQAASAERIKALERLLGHFLETFCDLTWDPQKEPEVIEARTLLKEGDQ